MEEVRVLMVEDNDSDAVLIRRELGRLSPPPDVQHVRTQPAFVAALDGFAPHVILCDHNIPGFGGWEALELAQRARPDVPFILVTGSLDEETAVRYLKDGAADYILKDRLVRLGPALLEALERARQRDVSSSSILNRDPPSPPYCVGTSAARGVGRLNVKSEVERALLRFEERS